jgi:hypothetical protein
MISNGNDELDYRCYIIRRNIRNQLYDVANLVHAIQKAAQEFHEGWKGILGMGSWHHTRALDENQSPLTSSGYFQSGRIRYTASCGRPHSTSANSCQPIPFESPWMDTAGLRRRMIRFALTLLMPSKRKLLPASTKCRDAGCWKSVCANGAALTNTVSWAKHESEPER